MSYPLPVPGYSAVWSYYTHTIEHCQMQPESSSAAACTSTDGPPKDDERIISAKQMATAAIVLSARPAKQEAMDFMCVFGNIYIYSWPEEEEKAQN